MNKAYSEIMEQVQVTDEMRQRVLKNVQAADLSGNRFGKLLRFSPKQVRRYLSLAACLAVLILGAITLPGRFTVPSQPAETEVMAIPDITEASSLQELSQRVGFDLAEVEGLPFQTEETVYTSYWAELAEITYSGEDETAVFRKSAGSDDNSGDFSEYAAVDTLTLEDCTVTLKGDGERYTLAIWNKKGYAYSLSLTSGLGRESWTALIEGIE